MASVSLQHIDKWYSSAAHAVRDLSFTIEDGEFFGLLGPSGSGKTSVLRMMAGLERVSSGRLLFDDVSVEGKTPQQRNVAMVFEQNALYPHMTARQNIAYPLKIRGMSAAEIGAKVDETARLLNITHLLDRRASQMSGGQQQRVAIARALVRRPNLLCLDEPIAHLDTLLRARLRGELKRLQRALRTTSVIVTHDPIEAMTMTDRLAIMRDGVLQQIGAAHEIHERPVNAFVAQFFGLHSMNVIDISSARTDAAAKNTDGRLEVKLPAELTNIARAANGRVSIGVRPSGLTVQNAGANAVGGEALHISGRVYVAEQLGEVQLVTVQTAAATVQAFAAAHQSFAIDQPVDLIAQPSALYVFEGEDQRTVRFARQSAALEVEAAKALAV